ILVATAIVDVAAWAPQLKFYGSDNATCLTDGSAWKHVRESSVYQPGFCWVLLLLLAPLGLYVAALGLFYMLLAELSPKRAKCPRHVAQRLVMQVASSVLCHAIKQCMQLAVQKLTWYHSVQAQEARWQPPSRMVERAPGGDDSPDEFFDALGPSEGDDDGADHPSHQYVQDSSEDLAPELLSSGSSEAIATRVAQAVSNALHLTEGRALALIPSDWQQMRNVTLCMRAMTRGECFHPHTVHVSDDFGALPAAPEGPTVPGPAPARTACPRARMTIEEVDEAIADLELSAMIDTLEEEEATNPAITEETEADLASNEASAGMEAWLKQVGPSGVTEVLPESRAARRDRWSHLSEEALANEMLDMELGALVSSLEEPMDEATLNEVAADMLLNPMPDTAPPASSSASSGSTPAPVLLPLAHAYTRSGILGFLLWLNKDGRSKVNTATLPDHHRDNPIGRQSGSVPFSGQSTEQIEILVAKLGTTEGCYIGPSLARDCGAQPQLPQGGLMDTRNQEVQALAAEAQAGVVERVQELSGRSPGICGPVALEQHIAQQNQAELQAKKAGVIQAPFVPEHGARHRHQDNDLHTFAGSSSNPRILMLSYLQDGSGYGKLFLLWMPDVYNRVSPWNPPLPDCRRHKTIKVLEAVQAENIYAASKRFAPKQARRRLQLRTKEGHLLSHEQEFLRIRDYFTCLYKGPSTPPVMLTHTVCFEETEVQMALGRLAAGKAMPQHSAPAAIWRKCSVQVASRLCQQLNASLVTGSNLLPLNWSISDMALIPKPGKAMTSPEQLRPISLLPMPAKALGLEERHVQVSIDKTVAIVELQGPGAAKCLERYLVSRPNHEGRYFKFVIAGEPRYVKVVPQHTYLGVIIGYKKPEQETAKHRRDLATGAFRRLKKILTCRDVPLKLRLTSLAGWVLQIHLRVFNRPLIDAYVPVPMDVDKAKRQLEEATQELELLESLTPAGDIKAGAPPTLLSAFQTARPSPLDKDKDKDKGTKEHPPQPKYHKGDAKGDQGRKGKDRGQGQNQWQRTGGGASNSSWRNPRGMGAQGSRDPWSEEELVKDNVEEFRAAMKLLSTVMLRHEDQLAIQKQDTSYVVFIQTGFPDSLAVSTHRVAQTWHSMKTAIPEKLEAPMRVLLFQHFIKTVLSKLELMMQTPSSKSMAVNMGLLAENEEDLMGMKWDQAANRHVPDSNIPTVKAKAAMQLLQKVLTLCPHPLVISRYHATRKLAQEYQGATLTMLLQVGYRTTEADEVWQALGGRDLSLQGRHAAECLGEKAGVADMVKRLQLTNGGNFCYCNAVIKGLLYAMAFRGGLERFFNGGMLQLLRGILQRSGATHLWRHPFWVAMMSGWRQPSRQHDGAEFMQFFLMKQSSAAVHIQVHWQAKEQRENLWRCVDGGSSAPLLVVPPADATADESQGLHGYSMQELIDHWHMQETLHASVSTPQLLALQIGRFDCNQQDVCAIKRRFAVIPNQTVTFPVFGDNDEVLRSTYVFRSAIVHKGRTPDSGHYFTLLFEDSQIWYADDGVPAVLLTEGEACQHYRDVYLLLYTLQDDH
ncbi:unnamed protein product, partial [Symbiodinium sp. KB8]